MHFDAIIDGGITITSPAHLNDGPVVEFKIQLHRGAELVGATKILQGILDSGMIRISNVDGPPAAPAMLDVPLIPAILMSDPSDDPNVPSEDGALPEWEQALTPKQIQEQEAWEAKMKDPEFAAW